jgi:hypothetical protein
MNNAMTRKLVIFSGGDRVGKSTLIGNFELYVRPQTCAVYHHSAPPSNQSNIFDFYRDHVNEWLSTDKEWCLFDRSYPCSFILEEHRRRNHGHMDDVIDLELEWLADDRFKVVHVAVEQPWNWSAKHHLIELKELFPDAAPWFIRDEYVARQKEHKHYYEQLFYFYRHITAFPNISYCPECDTVPWLLDRLESIV